MGRMIAHRKKDDKYRVWTTVTDEYLTDWITREEALDFIVKERKRRFKEEIKQLKKSFPGGYRDPRTYKMHPYK